MTADLARIQSVCTDIKADMEADVRRFEGAPFDGRNVSTMFGNLAATVSALAGMVSTLADAIDESVERHRESDPHIYADGSMS